MPLPDPFFPVDSTTAIATQMSSVDAGGVLMAHRMVAERVDVRELRIFYPELTPSELAAVETFWNSGVGQVEAFSFTPPGESAADFVIKSPPRTTRINAAISSVELTLIQVL